MWRGSTVVLIVVVTLLIGFGLVVGGLWERRKASPPQTYTATHRPPVTVTVSVTTEKTVTVPVTTERTVYVTTPSPVIGAGK
jgi:hypothetical protein